GRRRSRDRQDQAPGDHHDRPAPERAALRVAAEHHEGEEEANRGARAGRARRRPDAAAEGDQGRRAAEAPGWRQGEDCPGARREARERSEGDLMSVLVVAEHTQSQLKAATRNVVTAAALIDKDVHVLVAGKDCGGAAEAASKIAGVTKVLVADDAAYENMLAENVAKLLVGLASNYSHILAPATTNGKNYAP